MYNSVFNLGLSVRGPFILSSAPGMIVEIGARTSNKRTYVNVSELFQTPPTLACFLKGTKILTSDNTYKIIEKLSTSDKLMSHDGKRQLPILYIDKFESYDSP